MRHLLGNCLRRSSIPSISSWHQQYLRFHMKSQCPKDARQGASPGEWPKCLYRNSTWCSMRPGCLSICSVLFRCRHRPTAPTHSRAVRPAMRNGCQAVEKSAWDQAKSLLNALGNLRGACVLSPVFLAEQLGNELSRDLCVPCESCLAHIPMLQVVPK